MYKKYVNYNQQFIIYKIQYVKKQGVKMAKNLKLKSARAALDMSQQDVTEALGISRQNVNAIESGKYNPTIKLCISICKLLGKTLNDLFWEEN